MKKPDSTTKDVAKSLHTVTAIYQVAAFILRSNMEPSVASVGDMEMAIDRALVVLELNGRPDPYQLRARALALLTVDHAKDPVIQKTAAEMVKHVGGKAKVRNPGQEG